MQAGETGVPMHEPAARARDSEVRSRIDPAGDGGDAE